MKRMTSSAWGALVDEKNIACAKPEKVRNIRNIQFYKKYIQLNQVVKSINLFRHHWNNTEPTGTNLFRHVPAMFRPAAIPEHRYSLRIQGLSATFQKIVFRNVPALPEHGYPAESHERQGVQFFDKAMFRMFRTISNSAHVFFADHRSNQEGATPCKCK